jgi:hypothetical protein
MGSKGDTERQILWIVISFILLLLLIALFYSSGITLIKSVVLRQFNASG